MLAQILLESKKGKKNTKPKAKIQIKHPGILEVPKGKQFWQLSMKHYDTLVKKYGYAAIAKAFTNLVVWNRKKDPSIERKAKSLRLKLDKKYGPKSK